MLNAGLPNTMASYPGRMQAVESVDIGTAAFVKESNLRHPESSSHMSSASAAGMN